MKLRNFLFGAMASLAVLVGCTPNEDGQGEVGLFITVNNKSSVTFEAPAEGGSSTFEVNAGEDWFSEINLPEGAQEWVSVNPPTGKAGKTKVTVTALPNTGFNREQDVKFSIGMKHAWLKVKQAGAKGDAAATVILSNDFTKDGELVDKSKFGGNNPYLDKTEMWENWSGSGVADITYTSSSVDVRLLSKSTVNCLWFPKNKNAYLALYGIALNGAQNIKLSLAAVKNTPGTYKKDFVESEFKVWVSNDAAKWLDLDYTVTVDADGDYDNLSAVFAVPADTETLSLAFENLATDDGYRLDQIDMTVSEETPTVTLDFSTAVDKSFGTAGGDTPTTPDTPVAVEKTIDSGKYWIMNAEKTNVVVPIDASATYGYWNYEAAQNGKSTEKNAFEFTWVDGKGYTIKDSEGRYHYMTTYNSFNLSTSEPSDGSHYWAVTANTDGTYNIVNTVTSKTVNLSTNYPNYAPYPEVTGALPTLVAANDPVEGGDQGGDTPEPEQPSELTEVTVAEFLVKEDSETVWYKITGEITNIANSTYGNLTITQDGSSVYIFGLTATQVSSNDKSFESLGLKVGDVVTIASVKTTYNGTVQGGGSKTPAYYISHVAGEDGGDDSVVTPPAAGSTVVFDWTTLATETNTSYTGETIDGIALTGTRIATNKAGQLRIYAPTSSLPAGSLTLNSGDKKMTKIAFTFVSGKEGPLEATGYADGVWTGEANSVTFTNTGAQAQVTKIEITLAE